MLPRQAQDTTFQIEVKIVAEKRGAVAKMEEMQRLWQKRGCGGGGYCGG